MMNKNKRIFSAFLIILMLSCISSMFAGCSKNNENFAVSAESVQNAEKTAVSTNTITKLDDLHGKKIGCLEGSAYISKLEELFPDSAVIEYITYSDLIAALKSDRIDAYVLDEPMAHYQLRETEGMYALDEMLTKDRYGFMLQSEQTKLCEDMNKAISELKEQGVLDALKEKWVTSEEKPVFDVSQPWDKPNGDIKVGLSLDSVPFSYLQDNEIVGYDVELMYMIAEKLGYGVDITTYEFSALIGGVTSGKEDVGIGCITYTPERAESMLFTDSTYDSGTVIIALDNTSSSGGFISKLKDSFEKTFIREERWKLIASGFVATIELSVLTLIFGTLAGFGFSFLLRSKNKVIRKISCTLSNVIDGLPLLIILMVSFYLIFAKTPISAIAIGVIGLSLDFANSVAGILNTGVAGVDKGQIEAAESMGYPRWKTFMKIVFPQAVNHMFSQYTGSVVGMVKGTSVIGYITVIDLTKAGDIIRNHTYEAFFPLISVAIIYFILTQIIIFALSAVAKKINPKYRKRQIKGVKIHD